MSKSTCDTLKFYALTALVLLLATCAPETSLEGEPDPSDGVRIGKNVWVYRVVDAEAQVACWVYSGIDKGGIDCLPLSETALEPPR